MTIQNKEPFVYATGNGVTATIPFTFPANSASDVYGAINGIDQSVTVVLSPDQINSPGGTLTFNGGAAPLGSSVLVYRNTKMEQTLSYPTKGSFPSKSHESAMDKLVMIAQDLNFLLASRCLRAPNGEKFIKELPPIQERSGKFLGFDPAGNPYAAAPIRGEDGTNGLPPYISDGTDGFNAGNWVAFSIQDNSYKDTGVRALGVDGLPPYISNGTDGFTSGNWIVDDGSTNYVDTGVRAKGDKGDKGDDALSPYVSDGTDGFTAGNWVADNGSGAYADTGIGAKGDKGDTGDDGLPPYISDGSDTFVAGNWIADNGSGVYVDTGIPARPNLQYATETTIGGMRWSLVGTTLNLYFTDV
ncbi:tail fiber [Vibrio phage CJY]|nr:tail fiber [Vibrio phage CJY]AIZ01467.1 tail fiber [Vibrio phage H1]AIZ01515.1 tail fiber [Vibrio phage H2 SGB-2014]AIZ01659.1 tail fiber [Vibrio phage J3]